MQLFKFIVIVLALVSAGCATSRRVQDIETKVGILEGRVSTIEQRQGIVESQSGDSRESVGYLKGKVEGMPAAPAAIVGGSKANEGFLYGAKQPKMSKRDIQQALKNAGFYDGSVDGVIGKGTKRAIRKFQQAMGLKADGIVGKETAERLAPYLNK